MTTADAITQWIGRVWSAALLAVAAIVYGAIRGRIHDWRQARASGFSPAIEADIVQALRNIADDVDPIDPVRAEQIRANVVDELASRRGGAR